MLIEGRRLLVERRKLAKRLAPGTLAIPGGHVEAGEDLDRTLARESNEELGIEPRDVAYICTLVHQAEELRKLHYFAVRSWEGRIVAEEAESVLWVSLDHREQLDFDVDRTAITEYLRLEREGGLVWRTRA